MNYFPQELAHEFFLALAVVALIWTVGLVWYISRTWEAFASKGQRLIYLSLLYASTLVVVGATEQFQLDRDVELRNIGTAGFLAMLGWALVVTYREKRENRARS